MITTEEKLKKENDASYDIKLHINLLLLWKSIYIYYFI